MTRKIERLRNKGNNQLTPHQEHHPISSLLVQHHSIQHFDQLSQSCCIVLDLDSGSDLDLGSDSDHSCHSRYHPEGLIGHNCVKHCVAQQELVPGSAPQAQEAH